MNIFIYTHKQLFLQKQTFPDYDLFHIQLWLNEYRTSPNTYITYRVVALRFYLWLKYKKLTLSTIKYSDLQMYLDFIQDPNPDWCGKRTRFNHDTWRPFLKELSPHAINHNLKLLKQMFAYLYNIEYLSSNPYKSKIQYSSPSPSESRALRQSHCLSSLEFDLISNFISQMPEDSVLMHDKKVRTRWIFQVLLFTGCRRTEVSNATMEDIFFTGKKLWLKVCGKGNKVGYVPLSRQFELSLNEYRLYFNLPPICERLTPENHIPLIIKSKINHKFMFLSSKLIWNIVKTTCVDLANGTIDEIVSIRLRKVSPHWLRHTYASLQVDSGIDLRCIQANMRHSSIETTLLYLFVEPDQRHHETITKFGC